MGRELQVEFDAPAPTPIQRARARRLVAAHCPTDAGRILDMLGLS